VHDHPHQAQERHEHIQTVAPALPVSKKSQGAGLHEHLHQKQQREHRRKCSEHKRSSVVLLPRHRQQTTVHKDQEGREALKGPVLGGIEHKRPETVVFRPGWDMQGLYKLDTTFQVEPTSLVDGEQGRAFVLAVVCDYNAYKQSEADQGSDEYKDVNEDGVSRAHLLYDDVADF